MSKTELKEVRVYNFSFRNFKKKLVVKVRNAVKAMKKAVVVSVAYLHKKLTIAEDYLLAKITSFGKYAEKKLETRIVIEVDVVE